MSDTEIQLDAPSQGGPPAVKFPQPGTSIIVGIVDVQEYQQRTIEGKAKTWDNGDPMLGKRVIGLVVENNGATIKEDDVEREAVEGDVVSFFCEGGRFYTWKNALTDHGAVVVGDVMEWIYDHQEKPKVKGHNGQKVYIANLRHAKMEDGDLKSMCIQTYHSLNNPAPLDTGTEDSTSEGKFSFNNQ